MSYLKQEVLVRSVKLTSYHHPEEFQKGQMQKGDSSPYVLPIFQNLHWNPSRLSDVCAIRKDHMWPELSHQSLPPAVEAGECSLWVGWQNISEEWEYFHYKRKAE